MSLRVCSPGLTSRASRMVPAPTVSFDVSSIRMKAPLSRFVGVLVGHHDRTGAQRHRADVVEPQLDWLIQIVERLGIEPAVQRLDGGADRPGAVLESDPVTRAQRGFGEPAHRRVEFAGQDRQRTASSAPLTNTSPRPTSMSSASSIDTDSGATATSPVVVEGVQRRDRRRRPGGQRDDGIADAQGSGRQSAGVAPPLLGGGPGHPLHRQPQIGRLPDGARTVRCPRGTRAASARRTRVCWPTSCTTLSPSLAATGITVSSAAPSRSASCRRSASTSSNRASSKSTRSILFTAATKCLMPKQFRDACMPAGLAQHARAGVDEQDRDVRVGRPGEHVAGVALVAGRVGEDVAAILGREEPVRHVDRDALFPLGAQAVGQRGEVGDALRRR